MAKVEPTIKQRLVFKEVVKGRSITSSMVKAGYSPITAKNTAKLTHTKGWKYLVDKYISEEKLAKVHADGLEATKYESRLSGKGESELIEVPDFAVRHKYLESGYKVRGKYAGDNTSNNILVINVSGESATRYAINPRPATDSE